MQVVVVGNPANTNAMICSHFAPSIPKENFTALTRLDHNRAKAQVSEHVCRGGHVEHSMWNCRVVLIEENTNDRNCH